jgi:hypothetical protein
MYVGFDVFTAVTIKSVVLWFIINPHSTTSLKAAFLICIYEYRLQQDVWLRDQALRDGQHYRRNSPSLSQHIYIT